MLEKFTSEKIKALEEKNLKRSLMTSERSDGVFIIRDKKRLISFSCNDYLGLAQDERVIEAAISATWEYGTGAGASRLMTGNHPLYDKLEELLAEMKGTEAACVFGSGYLTNIGVIPALVGKGDLIIADKLVHSCIISGMKLSGSTCKRFSHNDISDLERLLEKYRGSHKNCLIITEKVFSMDGDRAPIPEIREVSNRHNAWLMTDNAHGFGVVEECCHSVDFVKQNSTETTSISHGSCADSFGIPQDDDITDIQMGTLSKAIGSYGGYICGSQNLIDYIKTSAKSLFYSTALPPGVIASAIAALEIIRDDEALSDAPLEKARLFTELLGLDKAESAIVPVIIGDERTTLKASAELEKEGFLVAAIRPPTVPKSTSRLRFTFSVLHKDEDIKRLAEMVRNYV